MSRRKGKPLAHDPVVRAKIIDLARRGKRQVDIAKRFNRSQTWVAAILNSAGLGYKSMKYERRATIAADLQSGMERAAVARKYHCSMPHVGHICREFSVARRKTISRPKVLAVLHDLLFTVDSHQRIAERHGLTRYIVAGISEDARAVGFDGVTRKRGRPRKI